MAGLEQAELGRECMAAIVIGGAGVGAFVLGVIAEHTGLRPPIAVAAVISMVIWYTVWRQRNVIVQSLQTTTTPSKKSQQPEFV